MNLVVQQKLAKEKHMEELLKQNSYWYKALNRKEENYKEFVDEMKKKYNLRVTDKISGVIDNIEFFSSILETFKK